MSRGKFPYAIRVFSNQTRFLIEQMFKKMDSDELEIKELKKRLEVYEGNENERQQPKKYHS